MVLAAPGECPSRAMRCMRLQGSPRLRSGRLFDYASACAKRASTCSAQDDNPRKILFSEEVVEGFYGGEFVVFDVEDGVELGDLDDVVNFLGQAEEFQFATSAADGCVAADQFAYAGGIDVIDLREIEDDFFLAIDQELADGVAELSGLVAQGDASDNVDDGDVADFADGDGHLDPGLGS